MRFFIEFRDGGMFLLRGLEFRKRFLRFCKCFSEGGNGFVSLLWFKLRKVREFSFVKVFGKLLERWLWFMVRCCSCGIFCMIDVGSVFLRWLYWRFIFMMLFIVLKVVGIDLEKLL